MPSLRTRVLGIARLGALVAGFAAVSCGDRGPPVWAPTAPTADDSAEACLRAAALRQRVSPLLAEGRIDRALRVMTRAEEACPRSAPETWAAHAAALADIGRSAEAIQFADRIARSDRASDSDRSSAAATRARAEIHARDVVDAERHRADPELFDPGERRRAEAREVFLRAVDAKGRGDLAAAKALFLEAWNTYHPEPRALVEAGLAASALGDTAEARRLWDRAAYDDAAVAIRPELASGPPVGAVATVMAWSPSGRRLAVAGDGTVRVFDQALHPELVLYADDVVTALAFSGDERQLILGHDRGTLRIVDVLTGVPRPDLPGPGGHVTAIAPSPQSSGEFAVAYASGVVQVINPGAAAPPFALQVPSGAPSAIAWNSAETLLAVGSTSGAVVIRNLRQSKTSVVRQVGPRVLSLAFSRRRELPHHGLTVITQNGAESLGAPSTAHLTAASHRKHSKHSKHSKTEALSRHATSRAGGSVTVAGAPPWPSQEGHDAVVYAEGDRVHVLDVDSQADTARPLSSLPIAISVASAARRVAVMSQDGTLRVFSPRGVDPDVEVHAAPPLTALAVSKDRKHLAVLSADGVVAGLNLDAGTLFTAAATDSSRVRSLAFSPDARTLALGFDSPRIELQDVGGVVAASVAARTPSAAVTALDFSPDGTQLAALTLAPDVQIFDVRTAAPPREPVPLAMSLHGGVGRAVRFSPDGRAVLIAAWEGPLLWDLSRQQTTAFPSFGPRPEDIGFFPDGRRFAVAAHNGALLLGVPSGTTPAPAKVVPVFSRVLSLAVGAGDVVATAEADRTIILRDANGKRLHRFDVPEAAVVAVDFLNGGVVAAAFGDGTLRLLRAPSLRPLATLRTPFRRDERRSALSVTSDDGHVAFLGPDSAMVRASTRCRLGAMLFPFDVCAEQYELTGLLEAILAGKDPAEVDP